MTDIEVQLSSSVIVLRDNDLGDLTGWVYTRRIFRGERI
jgi:hypothetical protein